MRIEFRCDDSFNDDDFDDINKCFITKGKK